MSVSFCLPHHVAASALMICSGLCACTEMLWMCVLYFRSNLVAVMDWGGANSRFLGLVSVWAARSFDQTALRLSVIKRIRQIDVKYITHIASFGVTA